MLLLTILACADTTGSALVLTGWEYEWETLSHRIGYLRAEVHQDSSLGLGLLGGDWSTGETASDTPHYRVRFEAVQAPATEFAEGEADLEIGPAWTDEGTLEVSAAGLPERARLVALLQGFAIDPGIPQPADYPDYPNRYGYTSQGFAFTLGEPTRDGDRFLVPWSAAVRWSPQDREDMNAAIPYAHTGIHLRVLVVSTDGDVETADVADHVLRPENGSYTDQPPMEVPVDLSGRGQDGFVGWTRFDLRGNFAGPDVGEGDYLRAMGVEVVPDEVSTARFTGTVTASLSNSSLLQLTRFDSGFGGTLVRIANAGTHVTHYEVEGSHPVGEAEAPPTLPEDELP